MSHCRRVLIPVVVMATSLGGCRELPEGPRAVRLIDHFASAVIAGTVAVESPPSRSEWTFGGDAEGTLSWKKGLGIASLAVRDGRLAGKTSAEFSVIDLEPIPTWGDHDVLHSVAVRMTLGSSATLAVSFDGDEEVDFEKVAGQAKALPWSLRSPVVMGDDLRTYTLSGGRTVLGSSIRHILISPSDVVGTEFAIESVQLTFRKEHLAGIPTGVSWQGLDEIYHETIVSRAPQVITYELDLPPRPWLDLSVGTVEEAPVGFQVVVRGAGRDRIVFKRTVTTPHRWSSAMVDLAEFAGRRVEISMAVEAAAPGALGFWGAPVVRQEVDARKESLSNNREARPRNLIMIVVDTLRKDHLSTYGYDRETSPNLTVLAAQGALFEDSIAQATWTKASMPAILTSLYPDSHTVQEFDHRLPASATTLAEVFRDAGYATLSLTSILFVGQFTNLHQGFEQLHESGSLDRANGSKVAREYVDRLILWLEDHQNFPFFALLHVQDPHDPFEPYPPYDRMWADPTYKEKFEEQSKKVRKYISDPLMKAFGMPTKKELAAAEIDAKRYVSQEIGWYDGSIRALDAELGRLLERLDELHLNDNTLIALVSDHGEEFLEHGRHFHGQSVYGELSRVPMILKGPGVAPGVRVAETVESIDLMPTILDLIGLAPPLEVQGQSLASLISNNPGETLTNSFRARPAFTGKAAIVQGAGPAPRDSEAYSVIDDGWKLVHHIAPGEGSPDKELFNHQSDPLNLNDVAAANPEIVERLTTLLETWRKFTESHRLPADSEAAENLSQQEMEQLKSLGYL